MKILSGLLGIYMAAKTLARIDGWTLQTTNSGYPRQEETDQPAQLLASRTTKGLETRAFPCRSLFMPEVAQH